MKATRRLAVVAAAIATLVVGAGADDGPEIEKARARAEASARTDLAARRSVAPEAIRVVEVVERTWPDERLGCWGRRMVLDPVPVPGFRLVLSLDDRRYVYHADRAGRSVPCDRPAKPIGPIQ